MTLNLSDLQLKLLDDSSSGLIPVIVQNSKTLQVLMLGFANQEAINNTLISGNATFYSRSRNELWVKGETSGNYLHVEKVLTDCDTDTLLYMVDPDGPACHTGTISCFSEEVVGN